MNADGTQRLDRSLVAIAMGSQSDWATMQHASTQLDELSVAHECQIVSAHRTPEWMFEFAQTAEQRGFKVIIAGAGGAAHLPGMIASLTELPVFGVPIESRALKGMDSLLSIVQMPGGVPVARWPSDRREPEMLLCWRPGYWRSIRPISNSSFSNSRNDRCNG